MEDQNDSPIDIGSVMATSNDILSMVSELSNNLSPVLRPGQEQDEGDKEEDSVLQHRLLEIQNILQNILNRLQL